VNVQAPEPAPAGANRPTAPSAERQGKGRKSGQWGRSFTIERLLAATLIGVGGACGVATYVVMYLRLTGIWENSLLALKVNSYLLVADVAITVALGCIVMRRVILLWVGRRHGLAGAKLHARLVLLFGLIAIIPTVIVSVFSTGFLNYGLKSWFDQSIIDTVDTSAAVAQTYLNEQRERINNDASALALSLRESQVLDVGQSDVVTDFLNRHMSARKLSKAVILTDEGEIVAQSGLSMLQANLEIPRAALTLAAGGEIVNTQSSRGDRMSAVVIVQRGARLYLYVERLIDPRMLNLITRNKGAYNFFLNLEQNRSWLSITVGLTFAVLAALLLMAAIWVAIVYATQLVKPITRLASAAEQIGGGDLGARVKIGLAEDELSALSRTFNVMAIQLQSQQHALMAANRQMDDRRRFTELILSGVSAGVIGLADDGTIDLPNRSASELLGVNLISLVGQPLAAISPDMAEIVEKARSRISGTADGQILFSHGSINRTFHVRVVSAPEEEGRTKLVVTFDDVSELLSAQRKAAWSDIARRIAHEIKNPLTPIQLSAERLKRKYLRQITEDPETFTACTDTIVRQVGDIGRMVDEFSAFARMPAPVLRPEDASELAKQAAFLQQNAHPTIRYTLEFPNAPVELVCDASQVNRAITNLMKNAAESINDRLEEQAARGDTDLTPGEIHLWMKATDDRLLIGIDDNGRGLPEHNRDRLTEPYVTTRSKGTGLGLAIVKKILEDHGGTLSLSDRDGGGAAVLVTFPLDAAALNVAESGRAHAAAGSA
jgi:two-component system, NtrC family, nitrogen regulation sensor histidine kinase NtrY